MSDPAIRIEPDAIYDDVALSSLLDVTHQALSRARRAGTLRYTVAGRRILHLGRWVLSWLELNSLPKEVANAS
jgi:hypothetical protein